MSRDDRNDDDSPRVNAVDALVGIGPGETTGTETLGRYEYQIKVAVHRWLSLLTQDADAQVLCEYIDDITTITQEGIHFAQVKTRDRGSWSIAKVFEPGGGVDALARSYLLAVEGGCHDLVSLELILEGPPGSAQDTRTFFADPTTATASERKRVTDLGIPDNRVDDFLRRLTITAQYHARKSIDGVTIQVLTILMGGHTADVLDTHVALLERVREAHLGLIATEAAEVPLALQGDPVGETGRLSDHALTREQLLMILPPVPELEAEQRAIIAARAAGAAAISDLEFKLRLAGATSATVVAAQTKRAEATAKIASRSSIGESVDRELQQLEERVLEHGIAVASELTAVAPQLRGRTGEAVFHRLVQQQPVLSTLDESGILSRGELILGLLCELSDRCLFDWRAA